MVRQRGKRKKEIAVSEVEGQGDAGMNTGHYFLLFLLVVVLGACVKVVADYAHALILAIILAIVFAPVHQVILRLTRGRRHVAALFSCLVLTLVVVLPLIFVGVSLIHQGVDSFNAIHAWVNAGEYQKLFALPLVIKVWAVIMPYLPDMSKIASQLGGDPQPINQTVLDVTSLVGKFLVSQGGGIMGNFTAFIGHFFLLLFAFFFMIRDGEIIVRHLQHLIPMSSTHEKKILAKVHDVSRSVLLGTFLTALAQGAAGGVAFWITGLPGLFWGSMMAFAALIPFVGTALIWVPAAGYLVVLGRWEAAAFMAGWCVLVVGLLDNLIRPLFMKGAANMSPMLIFFALIGGINSFGLIGLLYGPLLFGLALVLLYIYEIEFEPFLARQDRS
ncbi:MAG: AI-2E family transporter [Desulfobulbaceae bacterium]|nr:AI-2E family transporter [Desulfobulbaceae bacterium]